MKKGREHVSIGRGAETRGMVENIFQACLSARAAPFARVFARSPGRFAAPLQWERSNDPRLKETKGWQVKSTCRRRDVEEEAW